MLILICAKVDWLIELRFNVLLVTIYVISEMLFQSISLLVVKKSNPGERTIYNAINLG